MSPRDVRDSGKSSALPFVLGCVGGGCLLVIVAVVVTGLFVGKFVKDVKNLVADTPSVAVQVPTPAETAALEAKLAAVTAQLQAGQPATLVLTAAEVNALIAREQAKAKDPNPLRVQLEFTGDTVCGKVSIPFPQETGAPKYLNGEADLNVRIAHGQLELYIRDFRITDRQLPALVKTMIATVKEQNLADDFNRNPNNAEARAKLQQVERLEIRDGQAHVQLRPPPGGPATPAPSPARPPEPI